MYFVDKNAIYFDKNNPHEYVAQRISDIKIPDTCKKFYAVKMGNRCICFDWETCKSKVDFVSNAKHKSFYSLRLALEYLEVHVDIDDLEVRNNG